MTVWAGQPPGTGSASPSQCRAGRPSGWLPGQCRPARSAGGAMLRGREPRAGSGPRGRETGPPGRCPAPRGRLGQRDRVAAGQAMIWAQADHSGAARTPGGVPGQFGDPAAGEGHIDVASDNGVQERGSHIRCSSTVTCGASAANRLIRWGASTGAAGGVIPSPHGACLAAATRRTAALAAATSSRMTFERVSSSAPALVRATWRVVRVNSGVPSPRSRRRISSLSVGAAMCSRSAARPKCKSVATATNASTDAAGHPDGTRQARRPIG